MTAKPNLDAKTVPCPVCGARAGDDCRWFADPVYVRIRLQHRERRNVDMALKEPTDAK